MPSSHKMYDREWSVHQIRNNNHRYRQRHPRQLRLPQVAAEHHADEADQEAHQLWNELINKVLLTIKKHKLTSLDMNEVFNYTCNAYSSWLIHYSYKKKSVVSKRPSGEKKVLLALAVDMC